MATKNTDPAPEPRATPLEPGAPVEVPALSQMGGTFAERAKAAKKTASKAVEADSDGAENKAVSKKSASKK